ncbi:CASP-like protein 1F2 [Malania oleifera]|uniref:CASP-like protein 1F2 n=1 Tax=Malania oleifera TaxID=397392 RepID=UPI0025ADB5E8|nr:CASP-like protein 1F2 [Malania oleifera]
METQLASEKHPSLLQDPSTPQRSFFFPQLALRILAFAAAFAAIFVLHASGQSVTIAGVELTAKYYYSSAFKFLLGADVAACALSLLSLFFVCVFRHTQTKPKNYFFLILHDMVAMVLLMAGSAAATAIGYVGHNGQDQTAWIAICDQVGKFCMRVLISIILSYLAFACFFLLAILSAHKLKSSGTK